MTPAMKVAGFFWAAPRNANAAFRRQNAAGIEPGICGVG